MSTSPHSPHTHTRHSPLCHHGPTLNSNRAKKLLITYDTPQIAVQKANYIEQNHLGGAMFWELDADKPVGGGSLIEAVRMQWGMLDTRDNALDYPKSSEHFFVSRF